MKTSITIEFLEFDTIDGKLAILLLNPSKSDVSIFGSFGIDFDVDGVFSLAAKHRNTQQNTFLSQSTEGIIKIVHISSILRI